MDGLYTVFFGPVGGLWLVADGRGLTGVHFENPRGAPLRPGDWARDDTHPVLRSAAAQLGDYFEGRRRRFDLPLAPSGTAFQRRVWSALGEIGFGVTVSYAELARRAGVPGSARAVGGAVGRNPLAIVLPCHRVVGSDGSLTGFGGGLDRKRWLLAHEGAEGSPAAPPRTTPTSCALTT